MNAAIELPKMLKQKLTKLMAVAFFAAGGLFTIGCGDGAADGPMDPVEKNDDGAPGESKPGTEGGPPGN